MFPFFIRMSNFFFFFRVSFSLLQKDPLDRSDTAIADVPEPDMDVDTAATSSSTAAAAAAGKGGAKGGAAPASTGGAGGVSGADKQKYEKKIKDLEKKVELYKKQDAVQKAEV